MARQTTKWLMKTEPNTYSFDDLISFGKDHWDGVRNHQAQANMKRMKNGDEVLIYHSVKDKCVVGIAKVVKEAYPDPTDDTGKWIAVDVQAVARLNSPVTLADYKALKKFSDLPLIRQSRLSVMEIPQSAWDWTIKKAGGVTKV